MKWKKSKSSGRGTSWVNYDSLEDKTLRLQITKIDNLYEVHLFRRMARNITDYIMLKKIPPNETKKLMQSIVLSQDIKKTANQLNKQYRKYADMKHVKPYIKESSMKLTDLINETRIELGRVRTYKDNPPFKTAKQIKKDVNEGANMRYKLMDKLVKTMG